MLRPHMLPCKATRQCLLTLQVSRYYLLALQSSTVYTVLHYCESFTQSHNIIALYQYTDCVLCTTKQAILCSAKPKGSICFTLDTDFRVCMAVLLEVLGTSFIPVIQNQLSPCLHQSGNCPSLPSAVEGGGYCVAPDVRPAVWLSAVSFPEQISGNPRGILSNCTQTSLGGLDVPFEWL